MSDEDGIVGQLGQILQGGAIVFGGNLLGAAAAFLTRLISARYLGPDDYGLLVLGITVLGLSSIVLTFGLSKGLAKKIPNSPEKAELFQSSLLVSIPASAIVALLLVVFSESIASLLGSSVFAPVLVWFAATLPFYMIVRLATACMQGFKDSRAPVVFKNISFQTLIAVLVSVSVVIELNVVQIGAIWPTAGVFSALVALYYVRKRTNVLSTIDPPSTSTAKHLFAFSVPLLIADIGWEIMVQIDNLFLNYFHTSQAVGAYDAAFMLAMPPLTLIESFGFMLLPVFSDLYQDTKRTHLTRIYQLATKWMVLAILPVYLVVITFPDVILQLIYGSAYTIASTALIIVFTGAFVPVLLGLSQQAHIAFGNTRTIMIGNVAAAVINLLVNLVLVPALRIEGAALASALALGSLFIYWTYMLYAETGIQPISRGMVYPVAASSVVFVGVFSVTSGLSDNLHMWMTIIVYCILHILIIIYSLEDEDRNLIRRYSNQLS